MRRLCPLAALAVLSLAFAPAPLPRREGRGNNSLAVGQLLGTWRATGLYFAPFKDRQDPVRHGVATVAISPTQWVFDKGGTNTTYDLRIHSDRRPVEFDLMQLGQNEPYGRGLMRRDGKVLTVIYNWGERPKGFDNSSGGCLLTLVRESAAH